MAFDPSTAKPLEFDASTAKPFEFDPSTAKASSAASPPKPATPTADPLSGFGGRLAGGTSFGAVGGFFAPEATMATGKVMGALPFPAVKAAGKVLERTAPLMRSSIGARTLGGLSGAAAGAAGETLGTGIEVVAPESTAGKVLAESARILTPDPFSTVAAPITRKIAGLLAGSSATETAAQVAGRIGKELKLSPYQEKGIEKIVNDIRSGVDFKTASSELINILRKSDLDAVNYASKVSADIEKKLGNLQKFAAEQSRLLGTSSSEELANLIARDPKSLDELIRLRGELETSLSNVAKSLQQAQRDALLAVDKDAANRIGRQILEVSKYQRDTLSQIDNLTKQAKRVESLPGQIVEQRIGAAALPTKLGEDIRKPVVDRLNQLRAERAASANRDFADVGSVALAKERQGGRISDTDAYKEAQQWVKNRLTDPETKLARTTSPDLKKALDDFAQVLRGRSEPVDVNGQKVQKIVPASFGSLEDIRRKLGDRAAGLPSEGYNAIGQQMAGDMKNLVENIMNEFSEGTFKAYLSKYKELSRPINDFKTPFGQVLTGRKDVEFVDAFSTPTADLGKRLFSSAENVRQYIALTNGNVEQAEKLARLYAADSLRPPSGKNVQAFIDSNRDWLPLFPNLQADLVRVSEAVPKVERRLGTLQGRISEAEKAREARFQAGFKEVGPAEKPPLEGVAKDIRTWASDYRAKIDAEAKTLLGEGRTGPVQPAQVRKIVEGADPKQWETLSNFAGAARGKDLVRKVSVSVLADKVEKNPVEAAKFFNEKLAPVLEGYGFMTGAQVREISRNLSNAVALQKEDPTALIKFLQSASSAASRGVERGLSGALNLTMGP